jgi:transposase
VTLVVMEPTSDYWKPVFYLLEAEGFTCWLLNARHVKKVPGRPKTDKLDAVWLAKVAERGMCRPSLVHPRPVRELRDLTRYRRSLIRERTAEKQRVEKLLEAQIKLTSVASNIFGVCGRQMLAAMLDGPPRQETRDRRGREFHPHDHLEPAVRSRRQLPRPGTRLLPGTLRQPAPRARPDPQARAPDRPDRHPPARRSGASSLTSSST